jgi:hypothetical protein
MAFKSISKAVFSSVTFLLLTACMSRNDQAAQQNQYINHSNSTFNDYWYSGNAELSSYELEEARYGEIRKGEAVLVFVTEDFLTKKQVKKESETKDPFTSVLKLNLIKKFTTGIYDYSMMSSIFTPINQKQNVLPIKVSTSSQEWCGHSWIQLNESSNHYQFQGFSYFEKEGDVNRLLQKTITEDGLWNQIRFNPGKIPNGEVQMIPSTQYLRLSHQEVKAYQADIQLQSNNDSIEKQLLSIHYPELNRRVQIEFETNFPHHILGWTEEKQSGDNRLTTKAKLKARIKSPYWSQNRLQDSTQREKLKLNEQF